MTTYRVYECDSSKKAQINALLEADPYSQESFARTGYKVKDGLVISEDKTKIYIYIKSSEEFAKKADKKLEGIAKRAGTEVEKRVVAKIIEEEEQAEAGLGDIFG